MNIFNKVALQSLKKNRARTIVTIIGVVLSAAMITAVITFGVSLLDYMIRGAIQKYGDWHIAFLDVEPSFVEEQVCDSRVARVAYFDNIGYAALEGGRNPEKPYLFVAGFNEETFDTLPVVLLSGRLPENSSEILVPAHVAANGGIQISVGDTLTLSVGSRRIGDRSLNQHNPYISGGDAAGETLMPVEERTYTVVGICQRPAFEERSAPGYTLITMSDPAAKMGSLSSDSLSLYVALNNPRQAQAYADGITADSSRALNSCARNGEVLRFMGLSDDRIFNTLLYAVGGIVIAIIMIGSVFLIYNAFNISLNERTRQIGILSSVGATAKQLRESVLFEGLCIGAVGIPIGILVGIVGMGIVLSVVADNFQDIIYSGAALTLTVSVPAIICAAAVSIVTILISAYIPAKRACSMPVMECIRQTNEIKVEAKAVKISRLEQHLYGLEGNLALKNFKRNKKRYRSIVLSLVLSVVLFIATGSFVIYLQQASERAVVFTTYDIGFGSLDMDDSQMLELYDRLKNIEGVSESSYQVCMNYFCTVPADALSDKYREAVGGYSAEGPVELSMTVQFLDDDTYLEIIRSLGLPAEEYIGQNAGIIAGAKMEKNDNRLKMPEEFDNLFTNTSMDLVISPKTNSSPEAEQGKKVNIAFVDIVVPDVPPMTAGVYEQKPYIFQVLAPWSLKETLAPSDSAVEIQAKGLTFQSDTPYRTTTEMKAILQEAGIASAYTLINVSEMLEESRNYIFIANVFAYTFILLISLIAAANVFNTISTNIKLRRRELAMLRSVGMSDRDFNKMMRFECVFYGMRALLVGLPLALLCSVLIYKGMFAGGADNIEFVMPWGSIGISVLSVFLVIFVTMMYVVSRLKKENIIDALRDDMM